jgi:hypothetical protein
MCADGMWNSQTPGQLCWLPWANVFNLGSVKLLLGHPGFTLLRASDNNFSSMQYHPGRDRHAAASWFERSHAMRHVCPGTLACSNRSHQTPTGHGYPLGRWQESPIGFRVLVMTSETRVGRARQEHALILASAVLRWKGPRAGGSLGQRSVD